MAIGQRNKSTEESTVDFLIRGLWIQYEIEKTWNPNNDTTINYSEKELLLYYDRIPLGDSLVSLQPKYDEKTSQWFEQRTGRKRKVIHKAQTLIKLLDKKLIVDWTRWYQLNKSNADIAELVTIVH
jgi:hypothetical protein